MGKIPRVSSVRNNADARSGLGQKGFSKRTAFWVQVAGIGLAGAFTLLVLILLEPKKEKRLPQGSMGNFEDIWFAHRKAQGEGVHTKIAAHLKKMKYLDLGKTPTLKQIFDLEDQGYIIPRHLKEEARVRALAIAVRKLEKEEEENVIRH